MNGLKKITAQDINVNSIDTLIDLRQDFCIVDVESVSKIHNLIVRELNKKNIRYKLHTDNVEPLDCDPVDMAHTHGCIGFFSMLFYYVWLKVHNLRDGSQPHIAINMDTRQNQVRLNFLN